MIRSPDDMQKFALHYAKSIREATQKSVKVGLPKEKSSGKIYDDGQSVIQVGAAHEYGFGGLPVRSFLRVPFNIKHRELANAIEAQFRKVVSGMSVDTALGRIGAIATNISKDAFISRGYGTWPDISPATKSKKGSSQILVDTGTLRNSITWVIE